MGRWGQKTTAAAPQKSDHVESYTLSTQALEELYKKYGRPGEIAPGVKAERARDNHRKQAASNEEAPPPEVMGEIEETLGGEDAELIHEGESVDNESEDPEEEDEGE